MSKEKYTVKVNTNVLNIRSSAGTAYIIAGTVIRDQILCIVETKKIGTMTWGKLDNGKGWICLDYTIKIDEGRSENECTDN